MMALAAYAQLAGIFDWIAVRVVRIAGTSRRRLFALVYVAGIVTTALLSNDATIVALTPAVISVLRRYDAAPLDLFGGELVASNGRVHDAMLGVIETVHRE